MRAVLPSDGGCVDVGDRHRPLVAATVAPIDYLLTGTQIVGRIHHTGRSDAIQPSA